MIDKMNEIDGIGNVEENKNLTFISSNICAYQAIFVLFVFLRRIIHFLSNRTDKNS